MKHVFVSACKNKQDIAVTFCSEPSDACLLKTGSEGTSDGKSDQIKATYFCLLKKNVTPH